MRTNLGNFFVKTLIQSPLNPLLGQNTALITVTGRKSGKTISTPVNVACLDGVLTILSLRSRTWWRNLRGGQSVRLLQSGRNFAARGEVIEQLKEVASGLKKYFLQYPGYAKYFQVALDPNGKPDENEMINLANERVIIRLYLN